MNKAFVREQETIEDRCPRCGSTGREVPPEALRSHLPAEAQGQVSEPALFCPLATCEVVYFDQFGRHVPLASLTRPAYPKDPDAPICGCFGLTRDDVEQDVHEGGVARCRALLEKSKTPEARCHELAVDGHSCVPEMQRYYMKYRESRQRP